MSQIPNLSPISTISKIALQQSALPAEAAAFQFPLNIYGTSGPLHSEYFLSGAAEQVSYTFKKLGGDILDLQITNGNVFANYEEATLEYVYITNMYQAKNSLGSALGAATGTFNDKGELLTGANAALKYPKFKLEYARRTSEAISEEAFLGGTTTAFSASIKLVQGVQDYDIQQVLKDNIAADPTLAYSASLGEGSNARVRIRRVFYIAPQAAWRFFGYYGGLNVVGNLSNYGQYSDASTYEVVPTWQNKLQAMAYKDSIKTRTSHYSFEIFNNKIRVFPTPTNAVMPSAIWFTFTCDTSGAFTEEGPGESSELNGVNGINTLPFSNIPYENINSMGKQWIRRFSVSLSKETLGYVRNTYSDSLPIPGDTVSLNGSALIQQGKEEQEKLREELKELLEATSYVQISTDERTKVENTVEVQKQIPAIGIFIG